jgi:RNA polymerase sigma-70 factor, ECF subfamily
MPDGTAPHAAQRRATVEDLYLRHGALVQRTCRAILGDHHAAEDATQEVFARLTSRGVPDQVRDPRRWLLEVARNHCIDRLRAAARRPTAPIDCGRLVAAEDAEARSLAREHLRWLLSQLTPGQRTVVVRQAVLDEPLTTVASRLGLSYAATSQLLYRARAVLARAGGTGDAALLLAGGRIAALGRRLHSLAMRLSAAGRLEAGRAPLDAALALPLAALLVTLLVGGQGGAHGAATPSAPPVTLSAIQPSAVRVPDSPSRTAPATVAALGAGVAAGALPPPSAVPAPPGVKGGGIRLDQVDQPHCVTAAGLGQCVSEKSAALTVTLGAPAGLP